MRFLFASDSFKGTLTSEQISALLTQAATEVFPGCHTLGVPIADGGEGTTSAVIAATGGVLRTVPVHGPLMEETQAAYGVWEEPSLCRTPPAADTMPDIDAGTGSAAPGSPTRCIGAPYSHCIIEMAAASGLPMVPPDRRNPLHTTTYGTGELIKDALDAGISHIAVAIGGSATNDGGMGAMSALGIRFLDEQGHVLTGFGEDLGRVRDIDLSELHPGVKTATFTVMCDVQNPLTGPDGATYTFGKQKGGTPDILDRMEADMCAYAKLLTEKTGIDPDQVPGTGAAGGLGAALTVFLGARMQSGIETVLDLIGFDDLLESTDLVVTGEGRMDWQSAFGKVPSGVGQRCRKKSIPAVAIVGGMGEGAEKLFDHGIDSIMTTINGAMDLDEALGRSEELYLGAARRMFRLVKAGMQLHPRMQS
ncbi:MAG: glycerate kinase [Lachnospiraceae bacterium]|jgi:glycerate kinase|nr:glycerate kinase [Lachnospiraceae bacterium]